MAGALPSTLPSITSTVPLSRRQADLAMLDHRDLVISQTSDASELLAVSEHTEAVENTHSPAETHSVNPPSHGCNTLPGINSVSIDLGMTSQIGQAPSLSASQTSFTNPFTMGSSLRPPPS